MSQFTLQPPVAATAPRPSRAEEDTIVEGTIVRHGVFARVIHWTVALFFFGSLLTGMPIWSPVFLWMAALFGGQEVCRWLHPWLGVAFAVASLVMFVHWVGQMRLEKHERGWLGPKAIQYMRFQGEDPEVGKYNGGQKLFFFAMTLAMVGLLLTGLVLWFPLALSRPWLEAALVLHDITFILSAVAIIGHIYLGTAAEPGTFRAMTRGTVEKSWARLHHPKWYRDVTGDSRRR